MIDPKELRIGNLVEWYGVPLKVTGIRDGIYTESPPRHLVENLPMCDINPIPITQEWLERLGFEYEETLSFSEYFNKSFGNIKAYIIYRVWFCAHFDWMCNKDDIVTKRGWYVGRRNTNKRYEGWNYDDMAEVKYVHQLQNLYFALTGEELKVKE